MDKIKHRIVDHNGVVVGYEWVDEDNRWQHSWREGLDPFPGQINIAIRRLRYVCDDKDGREIYEGDRVSVNCGDESVIGIIRWYNIGWYVISDSDKYIGPISTEPGDDLTLIESEDRDG